MKEGMFRYTISTVFSIIFCTSMPVQAVPLDFDTFTADEGVYVDSGTVTATEGEYGWAYFYYDVFFVSNDMLSLSFDYELMIYPDNTDYLVAVTNSAPSNLDNPDYYELAIGGLNSHTNNLVLTGSHTIDLTSFHNTIISLAFGIEADDVTCGSEAKFFNFDLARSGEGPAPVPEPATILLFGAGLAVLGGAARKKRSKNTV
jgi:hypothetical protein